MKLLTALGLTAALLVNERLAASVSFLVLSFALLLLRRR